MKLITLKRKNKSFPDLTVEKLPFNQRLTLTFNNKKKLFRIWLFNFAITILLTVALGVFVGLFSKVSKSSPIWLQNQNAFLIMRSFCIAGLCLIYFPFALYIILFLIGITNLHKSLFIHYFLWFCFFAALIILVGVGITFGVILVPWDSYLRSKLFG